MCCTCYHLLFWLPNLPEALEALVYLRVLHFPAKHRPKEFNEIVFSTESLSPITQHYRNCICISIDQKQTKDMTSPSLYKNLKLFFFKCPLQVLYSMVFSFTILFTCYYSALVCSTHSNSHHL